MWMDLVERTEMRKSMPIKPSDIEKSLIVLRDKYPVIRHIPILWDEVIKSIKDKNEEGAEIIIKAYLSSHPKLLIRNEIAKKHRAMRREYLKFQSETEKSVRKIFDKMAEVVETIILKAAGYDGKIPLAKRNVLADRLAGVNGDAFKELYNLLSSAVRDSIWFGIVVTMDSAQIGLDKAKSKENDYDHIATRTRMGKWWLRDGSPIPYFNLSESYNNINEEQKAELAKTSIIFKTIFDRVKKRQLEKGIFKNKFRGQYQSGYPLSKRIWDLKNQNELRIRKMVVNGIAQGRPARQIASDIKGMTNIGKISKQGSIADIKQPGMYNTAFKNALRMVRTETNNAYTDAMLEYSATKGYQVMWNLSPGHPAPDSCDDQAEIGIFDPDTVPYPQHPNEACFLTTHIPGVT